MNNITTINRKPIYSLVFGLKRHFNLNVQTLNDYTIKVIVDNIIKDGCEILQLENIIENVICWLRKKEPVFDIDYEIQSINSFQLILMFDYNY